MPGRIPREERLLNLVLALQHTRFGLTKRRILQTVAGYAEDVRGGVREDALDRRFERDKDALRELGIDVVASDDPQSPGDNQLIRYHISEHDFGLPDDLDQTDLALIAASVALLSQLGSDETRGVVDRARALGAPRTAANLPDLVVYEPNLSAVQEAVLTRAPLRFGYHTQDHADALVRTVVPVAVVLFDGRWHLQAIDVDRLVSRTFLLQRMIGTAAVVQLTGPEVQQARELADEHSPQQWSVQTLGELDAVYARNVATISIVPGSEADVRLTRRGVAPVGEHDESTDRRRTLHYLDDDLLADELAGYGTDVRVESPSSVRDRVIAKLTALLRDHEVTAEHEATGGSRGTHG